MMEPVSLEQMVQWTGARLMGAKTGTIREVVIDSRKAAAGSLFTALKGEKTDGHAFIGAAFSQGAFAALTDREIEEVPEGKALLIVDDPLKALGRLAKGYREQFHPFTVGVTGSAGKTSTKDMVAAVLSAQYHVDKTQGNYNNLIGTPLTLLTLDSTVEAAVIEMGVDSFGDIGKMAEMAEPDVGIITNIGTAHLEKLGSRDGILQAKLEMADHLREGGCMLLNGDDDKLGPAKARLKVPAETFGKSEGCDCRILKAQQENDCLHVALTYRGELYEADLSAIGEHMAYNAAPAIMVGVQRGLSKEQILSGLSGARLTEHRLQMRKRAGGGMVVDDSYNANPAAMKASLKALVSLEGKRHVAILGDMFELGSYSEEGHAEVGRFAADLEGLDKLIACGKRSKVLAQEASKSATGLDVDYYPTLEELEKNLPALTEQGDVILVKASHGMGFTRLVDELAE